MDQQRNWTVQEENDWLRAVRSCVQPPRVPIPCCSPLCRAGGIGCWGLGFRH
jgi:hypothetical protein